MRPTSRLTLSSATCALALIVTTGAFAQQAAPSSAASSSAKADNSAVNRRDRSSQAMTPMDQPNDKSDIKLAAMVRRAIVKDKSLSTSAHNVKLNAASGVVTLRGPVANADEKSKIEADVRAISGVSRVDNQLDIKTP